MTFHQEVKLLQGKKVQVTTTGNIFTGTILSVGTEFLVLSSVIKGRRKRLIIRLAEITQLTRLLPKK